MREGGDNVKFIVKHQKLCVLGTYNCVCLSVNRPFGNIALMEHQGAWISEAEPLSLSFPLLPLHSTVFLSIIAIRSWSSSSSSTTVRRTQPWAPPQSGPHRQWTSSFVVIQSFFVSILNRHHPLYKKSSGFLLLLFPSSRVLNTGVFS